MCPCARLFTFLHSHPFILLSLPHLAWPLAAWFSLLRPSRVGAFLFPNFCPLEHVRIATGVRRPCSAPTSIPTAASFRFSDRPGSIFLVPLLCSRVSQACSTPAISSGSLVALIVSVFLSLILSTYLYFTSSLAGFNTCSLSPSNPLAVPDAAASSHHHHHHHYSTSTSTSTSTLTCEPVSLSVAPFFIISSSSRAAPSLISWEPTNTLLVDHLQD